MLTICLTCTKCGNVFEATTSEALPPGTRKKLGQTFVCSRCAPTPYKTVPRRRYHCTTCAAAIWPNGYEEKTIGIGGGTCCVCEREKPGKELHLVSQEHPVVTVERQRAELETLRARVKELEATAGMGAMLTLLQQLTAQLPPASGNHAVFLDDGGLSIALRIGDQSQLARLDDADLAKLPAELATEIVTLVSAHRESVDGTKP